MFIKRIFHPAVEGQARRVSHVRVWQAGPKQHFRPERVQRGAAEGWLSLIDGNLVLKTQADLADVTYRIVRQPGHYCCNCGVELEGEHAARRHVLAEHAGVEPDAIPADNLELRQAFHPLLGANTYQSPDNQNPSGYCKLNYYDCALVPDSAETAEV